MARRKVVPLDEWAGDSGTVPTELRQWPRLGLGDWDPVRFGSWLSARQRWRSTHAEPLPALLARDRFALRTMEGLDPRAVAAELAAPEAEPSWRAVLVRRAAAAATGRRRGA